MKTVLCIGGSDPTGGAGIAADLRVCASLGVHGVCVITAATAQSAEGVRSRGAISAEQVVAQLAALDGFDLHAIKIGMLPTGEVAEAVAEFLDSKAQLPVVCDPVLRSSSGGALCDDGVLPLLSSRLLGRVTLTTPNHPELEALVGHEVPATEAALVEAARELLQRGAGALLLKGGHRDGEEVVDWLVDREDAVAFRHPRIGGIPARGTGCALSTAIAAGLARGRSLREAVTEAGDHLHAAIEDSYFQEQGRMRVPHLFWEFYGSEGLP